MRQIHAITDTEKKCVKRGNNAKSKIANFGLIAKKENAFISKFEIGSPNGIVDMV